MPEEIHAVEVSPRDSQEPTITDRLNTNQLRALAEVGLTPVSVLRLADFHGSLVRTLAGADVLKCQGNDDETYVAHLASGKIAGTSLIREARLTKVVSGLEFVSPEGWQVAFPRSAQIHKTNGVCMTVYPFYPGEDPEKFLQQATDKDLVRSGMAVLGAMASMERSLQPEERGILVKNDRVFSQVIGLGYKAEALLLRRKGMLTAAKAHIIYELYKNSAGSQLPLRLVHHDLHSVNTIIDPKTKRVVVIDNGMLSVGRSTVDFGRWLVFLLVADRIPAMRQTESLIVSEGLLAPDQLRFAKAGGLIGWGKELAGWAAAPQ